MDEMFSPEPYEMSFYGEHTVCNICTSQQFVWTCFIENWKQELLMAAMFCHIKINEDMIYISLCFNFFTYVHESQF
jgi:hypothetical protein